jgi:dTDP-4-amino-4,6-dideoxygalactose transaminase
VNPGRGPLRFQRPSLPAAAEIERYFSLSRSDRWFSNGGPCSQLLQERLSERVGAFSVPVASGTTGLLAAVVAALESSHVSSGRNEALLPSFTFPATLQAATWAGLTPRFLDVSGEHWHLDHEILERELRARRDQVAVVIAVSSFGTPPPPAVRQAWERSCAEAGVPLIIDSAAGFGAVGDDRTPVGAQGDIEVVSFHATKPFAVGEGGAVFTRSRRTLARLKSAINFGLNTHRHVEFGPGLNGKMSELHAATALAVLDGFNGILEARRRAAFDIKGQLEDLVSWQAEWSRSAWQFIPVLFRDESERTTVENQCRGEFEARRYYEPLHAMPPFREFPIGGGGLDATTDLVSRLLCLPMANDLTRDEVACIGQSVRSALGGGPE